ncbi:MAG TPA: hypothetical protein VKP30_28995 [Polyangiaceae bacterium]|nr:hypothetical protein [Polyangiaceae bacterium]
MGCPRILELLCTAWLVAGCTLSEPSLVPLGHGPLSRAQRARESGKRASIRQRSVETQREPTESPAQSGGSPVEGSKEASVVTDASVDATTPPTTGALGASSRDSLDEWLGLYRGNDTTVFKSPEQSERRFDDPQARIRIEAVGPARLDLILVDSSNGVDMCRLAASVEGELARIDADQSCFLDPSEGMTARSRPGKAQRNGRQLTVDLMLDTTIIATESGNAEGTIEYHFDGQR